jgi:hypothetical protein
MSTETVPPQADPVTAPSTDPMALSDAQTSAMREAWIAYGHDPSRFDAMTAPLVGEAQAGGNPAQENSEAAGIEVSIGPTVLPTLTPAQAQAMADELIRAGHDPVRVREALEEGGYQDPGPQLTPEQIEHNQDWGMDRLYRPSEYAINYIDAGVAGSVDPGELADFHKEATGFLSKLNLEPQIGTALIERAIQTDERIKRMPEGERALWALEQKAIVERQAGGPEGYREKIKLAASALNMAPGEFRGRLAGAADAWTVLTLANHGAKLQEWRAKYPRNSK